MKLQILNEAMPAQADTWFRGCDWFPQLELRMQFGELGNFVSQSLWVSLYMCLHRLEKDVLGF